MPDIVLKKRFAETDTKLSEKICKSFDIHPKVADILAARLKQDEVLSFLQPAIKELKDPALFCDMKKAVGLIRAAAAGQKPVMICGDYDADGVCAAALLYLTLKQLRMDVRVYLPDRVREGYGISKHAVKAISEKNSDALLISVDCGVSNYDEVRYARSLGIRVIITDHHECPPVLPPADAILNPKRPGETYPFKSLCGAGVAFKLSCALLGKNAFEWIDLAALATIADLVPLCGENRIIAAKGLYKMSRAPIAGLAALLIETGLSQKKDICAENVAFVLAPRINAAGRMSSARYAFDMLTGMGDSASLAKKLCTFNQHRQSAQETIIRSAESRVTASNLPDCLMLCDDAWDIGIVGLAASNLVQKYARPTFLFGANGEYYTGSARSVEGIRLYEMIAEAKDLLVRFGGHEMAAGMTLRKQNFPLFQNRIQQYMQAHYSGKDYVRTEYYDEIISIREITPKLIESLSCLEPCGSGNASAVFLLRDTEIEEKRAISGGKHTKLLLRQGEHTIRGVVFGKPVCDVPEHANILITPMLSDYSGNPEVIVTDFVL